MKEIRADIPEGYFEESLGKTIARSRAIRTRRRAVLGSVAAVVIAVGLWQFLPARQKQAAAYDDASLQMMAEVSEMSELDVFLIINGE